MHLGGWNRLWFTSRSETLSATVLDPHSTVSAGVYMGMDTRGTRASSSNLSTQFRPAKTRNTWSLPVPLPVADLTRTHDWKQIRTVTIAHHIEYETTRVKMLLCFYSVLELFLALEVRNSGGESHYGIKKSIMLFWSTCGSGHVSFLKVCVWQLFRGCDHVGVLLPSFFFYDIRIV